MRHKKYIRLLEGYLEGDLGPDEAHLVEEHLASCASCRELKEDVALATRASRGLSDIEMPSSVTESIINMLREESRAKSKPRRLWARVPRIALAAAGAGIAIIIIAVVIAVTLNTGGQQVTTREERTVEEAAAPEGPAEDESALGEREVLSMEDLESKLWEYATEMGSLTGTSPQPVVVKSDRDYDQEALEDLAKHMPVHQMMARDFTMADALNKGKEFLSQILNEFQSLDEASAILNEIIDFLTKTEPASLPCYVEKANYEGKEALIIGLAAPSRGGETTNLTRLEIWVIDPGSFVSDPDRSILFFGEHRVTE